MGHVLWQGVHAAKGTRLSAGRAGLLERLPVARPGAFLLSADQGRRLDRASRQCGSRVVQPSLQPATAAGEHGPGTSLCPQRGN